MRHKQKIKIAAAVLLAAWLGAATQAESKEQKSCYDICMNRGGLTTGKQKQTCIRQCEDHRAGRR